MDFTYKRLETKIYQANRLHTNEDIVGVVIHDTQGNTLSGAISHHESEI
jgi:hypothetical protein